MLSALGMAGKVDEVAAGFWAFYMGVFTTIMFMATFKKFTLAVQTLVVLAIILFFLIAGHNWNPENIALKKALGCELVIFGIASFYTAGAEVINAEYGRVILPLGKTFNLDTLKRFKKTK